MQISLRFTAFIRCCLLGLSVAGTSRAQMGLALPTPPKSTAISGASCSKAFHYGDPAAEDYITNCLDEREKPYVVMLGHRKFSAVLLHVRTTTELRSRKVKVGDVVAAYTVEAVKFADGTVVPKRSTVTGKVEGLVQRGHGVKNAVMGLAFTAIQLPDGKQMPILSRLKAGFQPFVAASISVGMPGSPTTNDTARLRRRQLQRSWVLCHAKSRSGRGRRHG